MASTFGGWFRIGVAGAAIVFAGAGCSESFTATTGGGTTTTSAGGTGGDGTGGGGRATGGSTGGTTTTTTPECVENETRPCYTGDPATEGKGLCKAGVNICKSGVWAEACHNEVTPTDEVCNDGLDNDCDGQTDEMCVCSDGTSQECYPFSGTPGTGICKKGMQMCASNMWGPCMNAVGPQDETCDNPGSDDDCDNVVDNIPNIGTTCDTGLAGVCAPGKMACSGDVVKCVQNMNPTTETCDSLDNDCNNKVDDVQGVGQGCTVNLPNGGMCSGTFKCTAQGNSLACIPLPPYFVDNFSNGSGNWQLEGEWDINAPSGAVVLPSAGNPDPTMDHTGNSADNKLAGIVIGGNATNQVHGPWYMTSKAIDLGNATSAYLSFWRFLNTNANPAMIDTVEVSNNGGATWFIVFANQATPIFDQAWTLQVIDVTAYKGAQFQVRFGMEITVTGATVSSWNIDDVAVSSCPPG